MKIILVLLLLLIMTILLINYITKPMNETSVIHASGMSYPYTYAELQRDPTLKNGPEVEPVSAADPYKVPKIIK